MSGEYPVSLKTGAAVLRNLPKDKYEPIDILITQDGAWHKGGRTLPPERIFPHVDVIFIALHGNFGEDGKIQRFLDHHNVSYVGSGAFASAFGMNKARTKEALRLQGVVSPYSVVLKKSDNIEKEALRLFRVFPQPSVVKPNDSGSSLGVTIARDYPTFLRGLRAAFEISDTVLIEECISGLETSCGVLDDFRGQRHYALPPIEIVPPAGRFFDYEVKYDGSTREVCPANFSNEVKQQIMKAAIEAHRLLGARHYSRSDFIVGKRGVYFLEINTLPGLTEESLLPKVCNAVGCDFSQFLDHVVTLALKR